MFANKFYLSKDQNDIAGISSENAIMVNSARDEINFYRNGVKEKTLSVGGNNINMPTAQNVCSKLPNDAKSEFLKYFDYESLDEHPVPAGETSLNNAFTYMTSNSKYLSNWDVAHAVGHGSSEYKWPGDFTKV